MTAQVPVFTRFAQKDDEAIQKAKNPSKFTVSLAREKTDHVNTSRLD